VTILTNRRLTLITFIEAAEIAEDAQRITLRGARGEDN